MGNQWANTGKPNSSHEDTEERTLLQEMGTSHQCIGDKVMGTTEWKTKVHHQDQRVHNILIKKKKQK